MPAAPVTVEVPLPPVECSPNGRFHWRVKHAAAKMYRLQCAETFREIGALAPPVTVRLEFCLARPKTPRERYMAAGRYFPKDADNAIAAAKPLVDALKTAGVVPSDSARNVRLAEPILHTRASEHGGRACILVTIEQGV